MYGVNGVGSSHDLEHGRQVSQSTVYPLIPVLNTGKGLGKAHCCSTQ